MKLSTACLAGALACLAARAAHADKNYLVVLLDDVGPDKTGASAADYAGYAPAYLPRTPTVDTLATRGVRFTHAWATPLCSPTRVSLQTGLQPSRTGIGTALGNGAPGLDPTAFAMIASEFTSRGYTTGLFGKWHLGTRDALGHSGTPTGPFSTAPNPALAGWDRYWGNYDGYLGTDPTDPNDGYTKWVRVNWLKGGSGTVGTETTHATALTEQTAASWINARTQPWLAVVALNAAHSGTTASDVWSYADVTTAQHRSASLACLTTLTCTDRNRQVYQGLVEDADLKLAALLSTITPAKLENTVVVVLGDNGTPAAVQESVFAVAGRGKGTVYENGVRVPVIVADGYAYLHGTAGPTISAIGRLVDAKINTLDLYNTLLEDAFAINRAFIDSSSFRACLTVNDRYCGWTAKRYGYTEAFTSATSSVGGQATVSYGEDTMVAIYSGGCLAATFYDGAVDPLQTAPQAWTGVRAQRLRDFFTAQHTGRMDWANPTGAAVLGFCP